MGQKVYDLIPQDEVTGAWPDCSLCTWVAVGAGVMRLKYISRLCQVHGELPRL